MQFGDVITVTIYRTDTDAFGDPVDTTGMALPGCALLRHSTSENRQGGEQVTETAALAAPAEADVRASDAVVLPSGTRWQVDGRPHAPRSPFSGWEPAQVIPIRRVTG